MEKPKDPEIAETFKAMVGGKFALLTPLDADDSNMDDWVNKFNGAVTETANETLNKYRHKNSFGSHPISSICICATNVFS